MKRLRQFFKQPTIAVAQALLGDIVVVNNNAALITETEAYVGPMDQANHASRGKTKRTAVMFGPAGFTYVYLIYGMYWCLNVVTEAEAFPAAVLIRAVEPIHPLSTQGKTDGPGKLTRWFGIDGSFNNLDITSSNRLWIETEVNKPKRTIYSGPRIGVAYAGDWAKKPWRFWIDTTK